MKLDETLTYSDKSNHSIQVHDTRDTEVDSLASFAEEISLNSLTSEVSLDSLAAMSLDGNVPDDVADSISRQRWEFHERLVEEISRADRGLSLVSIVLIKWSVPQSAVISRALFDLRSMLREYDVVRRVESKMIGLIIPGTNGSDRLQVIARLARLLRKPRYTLPGSVNSLFIGFASWQPGQGVAAIIDEALSNLREISQHPITPIRMHHEPGVHVWLDGFRSALPVRAEPRSDGLVLRLRLPSSASPAQVRLRGGPASWPCQVRDVSLTGKSTLLLQVEEPPKP